MLTVEEHRDPACTDHPHCVCGVRLDDDGSGAAVCEECGADVLIGAEVRERAEVVQ